MSVYESDTAAIHGVADVDDSISPESSEEPVVTVTELLKIESWLDRQLLYYRTHAKAAKSQPETEDDLQKLQENLDKLQQELIAESSKSSLRSLAVRRLQLGQTLNKILDSSPEDPGSSLSQIDENKKKYLAELLEKQRELVSKTAKKSESIQQLKNDLDEIKKENYELKVNNRRLMSVINERNASMQEQVKNFSQNERGQALKNQLQKTVDKIVIQRQVLRGVILGSGVNWQQDPVMQKLVIELGESIDI